MPEHASNGTGISRDLTACLPHSDLVRKALDFLDRCAGEGIHFREEDGRELDAGDILFDLARSVGVDHANEGIVDSIHSALTTRLNAKDRAHD